MAKYHKVHPKIKGLYEGLKNKHDYTAVHSLNVANYALQMADELGFSDARKQLVYDAGLAHDLGKMRWGHDLLEGDGKLSYCQKRLIAAHSKHSKNLILEGSEHDKHLEQVGEIVLQHHERIDGSGYPKGLGQNEISLEAKILAVADSYDAMTTKRSYKAVKSKEAAVKKLHNEWGVTLDEQVVDSFLNVLEKSRKESEPI